MQAIEDITHDNVFQDLHKFQLTKQDWETLKDYQDILQVICIFYQQNLLT